MSEQNITHQNTSVPSRVDTSSLRSSDPVSDKASIDVDIGPPVSGFHELSESRTVHIKPASIQLYAAPATSRHGEADSAVMVLHCDTSQSLMCSTNERYTDKHIRKRRITAGHVTYLSNLKALYAIHGYSRQVATCRCRH